MLGLDHPGTLGNRPIVISFPPMMQVTSESCASASVIMMASAAFRTLFRNQLFKLYPVSDRLHRRGTPITLVDA